jgi:hypothetical protein
MGVAAMVDPYGNTADLTPARQETSSLLDALKSGSA